MTSENETANRDQVTDRVRTIIESVRECRQAMEPIWQLPDPVDCLYLAQIGMGEFIAGWLIFKESRWGTGIDLGRKLAQIAVDLSSALAETNTDWLIQELNGSMPATCPTIQPARLNHYVADALLYAYQNGHDRNYHRWKREAAIAIWYSAIWPDLDLAHDVAKALYLAYEMRVAHSDLTREQEKEIWRQVEPALKRLDAVAEAEFPVIAPF